MRSVLEGHASIESLPGIATEVSSTLRSSRYSDVVRFTRSDDSLTPTVEYRCSKTVHTVLQICKMC